jgi:ribosomal protein L37AE/L43A
MNNQIPDDLVCPKCKDDRQLELIVDATKKQLWHCNQCSNSFAIDKVVKS